MEELKRMVAVWRERSRRLKIPLLMSAADELQDWIDQKCDDPRRKDWCQTRSKLVEPLAVVKPTVADDGGFESKIN